MECINNCISQFFLSTVIIYPWTNGNGKLAKHDGHAEWLLQGDLCGCYFVCWSTRMERVQSVSEVATLQWRHDERDGVSNHRRLDCLLNPLFRRRSKETSKLWVTSLCERNSPVTGEFPAQRPVTQQMCPFDDIIMQTVEWLAHYCECYVFLGSLNIDKSPRLFFNWTIAKSYNFV